MVSFKLGASVHVLRTGNLFVATDGPFFDAPYIYYSIYLCVVIGVVFPTSVVRATLNFIILISSSTFLMLDYFYLVVARMAVQLDSLMPYCHIVFLLIDSSNIKVPQRQALSRCSGFFYHAIPV